MEMNIVTNNPRILALYPGAKWVSGGPLEVLSECRKRVHGGYRLVTHPLMGDIHLLANPFRTVILGDKKGEVDVLSLRWIEEGIERIHSSAPRTKGIGSLKDYQTVDFELARTAMGSDGG
jgi:hypothetical protein